MVAVAHIETNRASRHLVEVCKHASKMNRHLQRLGSHVVGRHAPPEIRRVDWSDIEAVISFGGGRCELRAAADALNVRIEARDQESLRQLKDFVGHRLETIGSRDHLSVSWQPLDASQTEPGGTNWGPQS